MTPTQPPIKLPISIRNGRIVDAHDLRLCLLENTTPEDESYILHALNSHGALVAACKLVLLFHSGGPWHSDRVIEWANGLTTILGPADGRDPKVVGAYGDGTWDGAKPTNEATTKNLCNAIRAALALAEKEL